MPRMDRVVDGKLIFRILAAEATTSSITPNRDGVRDTLHLEPPAHRGTRRITRPSIDLTRSGAACFEDRDTTAGGSETMGTAQSTDTASDSGKAIDSTTSPSSEVKSADTADTKPAATPHGPPAHFTQTSPGIAIEERLALASVIAPDLVWGRSDLLFRASHDGFSMAGFEQNILRYPGPSVLLVRSSTLLRASPAAAAGGEGEKTGGSVRLLGMFVDTPWKHSSKDNFGDVATCFFLNTPSSTATVATGASSPGEEEKLRRYPGKAFFSKSHGVGCGRPPNRVSGTDTMSLDTSLEVCTVRDAIGATTYQVDDVEVWGLGGDVEAQKKAWEWEEKEAERRRQVNVKDLEAEYDFLQLAGLVGQNRSGGSV